MRKSLISELSFHSIWYFIGGLLNNGLALFLLPYLSNMLTPAEYGIVQTANSIGLCLPIFFSLYIESAFARFYHDKKQRFDDVRTLYSTCFWFIVISGILILSFITYTAPLWFSYVFEIGPYPYIFLITYPYLFYQIALLGSTYLRQSLHVKRVTSIDFGSSVINLSLSLYLVYIWNDGAEARLTAIAISFFVKAIYYIYYSIRINLLSFILDLNYLKKLLCFSVPLLPSALSLWLSKMADRVIISIYIGTTATGLFSVANQIAFIVYFLQDAVLQALNPIQMDGFIKEKTKAIAYTITLSELMWITMLGIVLFIGLFSDYILSLFLNERFHTSSILIILLSSVYVIQAQYRIFSGVLIYYKKTKEYSYAAIVQSIISVILNILLIPYCGYEAAAYTSLISIIVFWIIMMRYVFLLEKLNLNYKFILGSLLLFASLLLFNYFIKTKDLSVVNQFIIKAAVFFTYLLLIYKPLIERVKKLNI